jgi:hypothetical protein
MANPTPKSVIHHNPEEIDNMRILKKKRFLIPVAVAVAMIAGGSAFAYFTAAGGGTGSAQTASVKPLTISQIGAGYDSLASTYHQDQCLTGCSGPTVFGNEINLAAGSGQLSNVVVAFRSYAGADPSMPITLTLYTPDGSGGVTGQVGPYTSVTTNANVPSGNPRSVFYVTFDFSKLDLTLSGPVVYGISFTDVSGATINVALSNSVSNLTVGSDVYAGDVFVESPTANVLSANGDAGSCATSAANVFVATDINCATPGRNYGAYGPGSNPANADIPAVEFNVVGGSTAPLWPGQTQSLDFAITNPNSGSVHVNNVTITVASSGGYVVNTSDNLVTSCQANWFDINGSPTSYTLALGQNVPTGITQFLGYTSISLIESNTDQSSCEGQAIGLSFSSN